MRRWRALHDVTGTDKRGGRVEWRGYWMAEMWDGGVETQPRTFRSKRDAKRAVEAWLSRRPSQKGRVK